MTDSETVLARLAKPIIFEASSGLMFNPAATKLLGYRSLELANAAELFRKFAQGPVSFNLEADALEDGVIRVGDDATGYFDFEPGELDGLRYWFVVDATVLARAESRFRSVMEQSFDAYLLFDVRTFANSGILDCNQAALDMLRVTDRAEILGKMPAEFSPEFQADGQSSHAASLVHAQHVLSAGSHRFRWNLRRSTGEVFHADVALGLVMLRHGPAMMAVWHDLTEWLEREALLRAAKETAELALKTRSDFLAMMSHEIRTPLNGVVGAAQLLEHTPLNADQADLLQTVRSCSDTLLSLIDDVLSLSKVEAGRIELEQRPVVIVDLVRRSLAMLQADAEAHGVRLVLTVESGMPAAILGDSTRLQQILLNLVSNAIKFSPHGKVEIVLRSPPSTANAERVAIEIAVRDSGVGIAPENVGKIFDAFAQADATTTRHFGGTGLGLTICRGLTERMGGTLEVESTLGKGSTFTVRGLFVPCIVNTLPLPAMARTISAEHYLNVRVLVADDHVINQKIISRILELQGCVVQVVADGAQAILAVSGRPFDLVFMDCQMPDVDGFEATREIRRLGLCDIPIIALTANAMPGDRERCLAAGMDDYISKPVRTDDVRAVLARWVPGTVAVT